MGTALSWKGITMPIPKFPKEPDNFKYFLGDPPEVKLEAWKVQERSRTLRYFLFCMTVLGSALVAFLKG